MLIKHNNKKYSLAQQQYDVYKVLSNADKPLTTKQINVYAHCAWCTNRISELIAMGIEIKKGRKKVKSMGKMVGVNTYII